MLLMIDNYDSFTYNLVQYFYELGQEVEVYRNDVISIQEVENKKPKYLVISPGPCTPKEAGISVNLIKTFKDRMPILGICLGYQQILYCEKGKIVQQKRIYHGYQSEVKIVNNKSIFSKKMKFKVGRYHSLKLKEPFFSKNFEITMRCSKTNIAMAFENKIDDIYGFQFHPESFLTTNGKILIKKILSA